MPLLIGPFGHLARQKPDHKRRHSRLVQEMPILSQEIGRLWPMVSWAEDAVPKYVDRHHHVLGDPVGRAGHQLLNALQDGLHIGHALVTPRDHLRELIYEAREVAIN